MAKKLFRHAAYVIGYAFLIGLIGPIENWIYNPSLTHHTFSDWSNVWYWIMCLILSAILYLVGGYFLQYRPRSFYYCSDIISLTLVIVIGFWSSILVAIFVPWPENIAMKISLICAYILLLAFLIYASGHRGLAIYPDKIRIFKFRIKTYQTTKVDSIAVEYGDFVANIHITVCGETTTFRLPNFAARLCQRRLKTIPTVQKEPTP